MTNINRNTFFLEEINKLAKDDKSLLISLGEDFYHRQISEITENILKNKNVKIVLIAGPSSSGKTTTSRLISQFLQEKGKKSVTVSLDDFFLEREKTPLLPNGKPDYENITALDIDCLNKFIDELYANKKAQMPVYNFITGLREEKGVNVEIDDNTIVVIEGIHALNPSLITKHQDSMFKVYICVDSNFNECDKLTIPAQKLRLMRRMIRDYYTRGRTIEKTLDTWQEVLDGENKFIKPFKTQADAIVDSTHMYEPLMYATHLFPLLSSATKCPEVVELMNMISDCEKLDSSLLPPSSLLHEFLG